MKGSLVVAAAALAVVWPQAAAAEPWCGSLATEDRPAAVGGHQVRVLYAVAADGADRSGERAARISQDVDEIDAWWRLNDPARTLRFDVAPFPCGLQADLQLVRLGRTAAELTSNETRFDLIRDDVGVRRRLDGFSKLLVYYEGPVSDERLCGQGLGSAEGAGIAVVYLAACIDIPRPSVAAHELLHTMGAIGDPVGNVCPESPAHVCDSTGDILYPSAQPLPLASFVLDFGRDDYYGHGGHWLDVRSSAWLRHLDAQAALAVAVEGGGSVATDLPGLACSTSCTAEFNAGTSLGLTAAPAAGQRFLRWGGACAGEVPECALTLDAPASVTATFAAAAFRLAVSVKGRGRVTSAAGLACPSRCARQVTSFRPVVLRAVPAKGWRLKGWSGACRGSRPTCSVAMTAASSARATFVRRPAKKKTR